MSEVKNEAVNPWVVQEPKQSGQPANGMHLAPFKGVEDFTLPQSGEAKWRWTWEVQSGAEKGKIASTITNMEISPTTLPGVLIEGLLGRKIQPGENVKEAIAGCVGKVYLVKVAGGPKGGKPSVREVVIPPQM